MRNSGGEVRKVRSDKKTRVNPALSADTHDKLERLAFACSVPKTVLAADIIDLCVNNTNIIDYLQTKYEAPDKRRVIPIVENGVITYA
ncbi:hypothetical protein [Aneurinibacillus sp. REN35]|uniref:hypothetical protein n=1 Tax=Aneurinibacillus sp. REN35 TaxID=3237286 RepID=UPI003526DB07